MKPSIENPSSDRKLDELLAARPVAVSTGFKAGVVARIKGQSADDTLDALLRDHPVEAAPRFKERTLKAIGAEQQNSLKLLIFSRAFWWAGATAAMLVVGFFTYQSFIEPTPQPTILANIDEPSSSLEMESADIFVMAEIDALFILADGLSDAELFLDEGAYATLDTISYDEAILF